MTTRMWSTAVLLSCAIGAHAGATDIGPTMPRTMTWDDDGTWEVRDFGLIAEEHGLISVAQSPTPGSLHTGADQVSVTIDYRRSPGRPVESVTWLIDLVDETPPLVEVSIDANHPWSVGPMGTTYYLVDDDDDLVLHPVTITASDGVDNAVNVTAALNGQAITMSGGAGVWVLEPTVVDGMHNWLIIEAVDDEGNTSAFTHMFERRAIPFHGGNLGIFSLDATEVADGYFIEGELALSSTHFDVDLVHPDSLSLYFNDDDGQGIDPVVPSGFAPGDCCDDGGIVIILDEEGGNGFLPSLTFTFTATLPIVPAEIELLGTSTWPDDRFDFFVATPAIFGAAAAAPPGGSTPSSPSNFFDRRLAPPGTGIERPDIKVDPKGPGGGEDDPPDVECDVKSFIKRDAPCYDQHYAQWHCPHNNYPGSFLTYESLDVVISGATIMIAKAYATDYCSGYSAVATGECIGDATMVMRTVPRGCAVGPVTIDADPSFVAKCQQVKGEAYALAIIKVTPKASTTDQPGHALAQGGVSCYDSGDVGEGGFETPGGGITVPVLVPGQGEMTEPVIAIPSLFYEYECRSSLTVKLKAAAGVHAYANDPFLAFFDWRRARARGRICEPKVNTTLSWELDVCNESPPRTISGELSYP